MPRTKDTVDPVKYEQVKNVMNAAWSRYRERTKNYLDDQILRRLQTHHSQVRGSSVYGFLTKLKKSELATADVEITATDLEAVQTEDREFFALKSTLRAQCDNTVLSHDWLIRNKIGQDEVHLTTGARAPRVTNALTHAESSLGPRVMEVSQGGLGREVTASDVGEDTARNFESGRTSGAHEVLPFESRIGTLIVRQKLDRLRDLVVSHGVPRDIAQDWIQQCNSHSIVQGMKTSQLAERYSNSVIAIDCPSTEFKLAPGNNQINMSFVTKASGGSLSKPVYSTYILSLLSRLQGSENDDSVSRAVPSSSQHD